MSQSTPLGRFVWYECMTTDPAAAQAFYTTLVGWKTETYDGGPTPYTMWVNDGTPIGGVMALPAQAKEQGAPPHWLAYVSTPDVDTTVAAATKAGATVAMPPTDIPTVGRISMFADPQGAMIAVYTPSGDTPGNAGPRGLGEMSWHELATTDLDGAMAFYASVFGWVKGETMDMGGGNLYQMFGLPDEPPLGGMFIKPKEMPVAAWNLYVTVDSVDAKVDQVKSLGGQIIGEPMEVPGGDRIVQCVDPQGAMIALHSKKAS